MAEVTKFDLDAIDELRLRRWARQHYVADKQRDRSWHSVILDEMHRKDQEHQRKISQHSYGAMVPLAPHARELPSPGIHASADDRSLRIDAPEGAD